MKKKLIILLMGFAVLLAGCSNATVPADNKADESIETNDMSDNKEIDEESETSEENGVLTKLDALSEADETGLNLKEYKYSFEDRKVADEGDPVFYLADFEDDAQYLKLEDSVKIYAFNGKCIGHTKESIEIHTIGRYEDWYYLVLDRDYRFLKVADVNATATDMSFDESEASAPVETAAPEQSNETVPASSETETTTNVPSEEPVEVSAESDKYTPDEAIAVYRGLMEAGGITWDPSIKDVTSWGTGFMYLDKGYPEWAASTDLESFAIGGHGGNSWTKYYMEVTGSDDECVYFTQWSSN